MQDIYSLKGELSVDKNELISSMLSFKDNIGMWKIVLNQITDADNYYCNECQSF